MQAPDNIRDESQWLEWCERKGYTNNGTTGWFDDPYGNLHWFDNMQKPTLEDKARVLWNHKNPVEYFRSKYCVMRPPHLVKLPDKELAEKIPGFRT